MKNFDVIIVGNGIMGLAAAEALLKENSTLNIAIIGEELGMGAGTMAAGAMLGCFGEVTEATFASPYGLAKLELAFNARKMWPTWLDNINTQLPAEKKIPVTSGTFIIFNTESSKHESNNSDAIHRALQTYSTYYEETDPRLIPGLNPNDNCRPLRSLFIPDENAINPQELINALRTLLAKHTNITFVKKNATRICTLLDTVVSVALNDGQVIKGKKILLAAGAYSQALIDTLPEIKNHIPRLLAGLGCAMKMTYSNHKLAHVVRSPNRSGACGIHMMPHSKELLYIGASNSLYAIPRLKSKLKDSYYLLKRAMEQFNQDFYQGDIEEWLIGNRPVTVDTFPLIGPTSLEGLWILTGSYRDGFHTAPFLAQYIAKEILGEKTSFINPFLPERNPIQTMNKEQAINEFVNQYNAAAYEHSISLPKLGWYTMLEEAIRKKGESIYDQLNCNIGLPADLLIMLELNPSLIPVFKSYYAQFADSKIVTKFEQQNQTETCA